MKLSLCSKARDISQIVSLYQLCKTDFRVCLGVGTGEGRLRRQIVNNTPPGMRALLY